MSQTNVVSSRVRLARNQVDLPFPARMDDIQKQQVWQTVCRALPDTYDKMSINQNDLTGPAMLAEQHWVSPELLHAKGTRGAAIDQQNGISVMVNEEDHLRIQAIQPGFSLKDTLRTCTETEQMLGQTIPYAFSDKYGYLTACPTNLGAGLRVSAMLHLPALTQSGHIRHIIAEVDKIGHLVRGFYGEGSDALGGYYQISNRNSLGLTPEEIVKRLQSTVSGILAKEDAVRKAWRNDNPVTWEDRVWRAYGILKHAKLMSFEEALSHLSLLRMGMLEDIIPILSIEDIDKLNQTIGPHTLSQKAAKQLGTQERDACRAEIIHNALSVTS
ncbi:MAG: ATP--guanido phosphotransferase [Oscillospiraceae bacterium]|nr:ATP--guanido phosphotransferase [Oscillospiraceae bacterium]